MWQPGIAANTSGDSRTSAHRMRQSVALNKAKQVTKMRPILEQLAESSFTEQSIWEGDSDIFPILLHYKPQLQRTAEENFKKAIICFRLDDPQLQQQTGLHAKTYAVDINVSLKEILALVCKKLTLSDPQSFYLCTLRGFVLNEEEPLFAYGLGTLLEGWELLLRRKRELSVAALNKSELLVNSTNSVGSPSRTSTSLPESPPSARPREHSMLGEFGSSSANSLRRPSSLIVFHFPPIPAFQGLRTKQTAVSPGLTVAEVIGRLCARYKVSSSAGFVLCTRYGLVLHPRRCLGDYGLGSRFHRWALKLIPAGVQTAEMHSDAMHSLQWTQVEEANMSLAEARDVIRQLDGVLAKVSARVLCRDRQLAAAVKRFRRARRRWRQARDRVYFEARRALVEQWSVQTDLEKRIAAANQHNAELRGQIEQLTATLHDRDIEIAVLNSLLAENMAKRNELETRLAQTTAQLDAANEHNTALQRTVEDERQAAQQERYTSQQAIASLHEQLELSRQLFASQKTASEAEQLRTACELDTLRHELKMERELREKELAAMRCRLVDTQSRVDELDRTRRKVEAERDDATRRADEASALREADRQRTAVIIAEHKAEISSLKEKLSTTEAAIENLRRAIAEERNSKHTLEETVSRLKGRVRELEGVLEDKTRGEKLLNAKVAQLEKQLAAAKEMHEYRGARRATVSVNSEGDPTWNRTADDIDDDETPRDMSWQSSRKPSPPPMPAPVPHPPANAARTPTSAVDSLQQDILTARQSLQHREDPPAATRPRSNGPATMADVIFWSLQKRFSQIKRQEIVEELEADEDVEEL